ncbi:MAG: hypothetical protein HY615_14320 [Candidatus Rokubacteria bacterium]|nr:hypothetical protein [Candidatus Rokubacteria bacterium]
MTEFIPVFVLTVLGAMNGPKRARMRLVLTKPYAYLENRLRRALEERDDVEILVDRRRGERRRSARPVREDRRQSERRTPKEAILEMVIEGDPGTMLRTIPPGPLRGRDA